VNFPFGSTTMRASHVLILLSVVVAQAAFSAETNVVSSEVIAKVEAVERQALLESIFAPNTNGAWNLGRSNLLKMTFIRSHAGWYTYEVKENGKEQDRRITSYAAQATRWKDLSEEELKAVRVAIAELPSESSSPPLDRTVLVSFRHGTNWVTRTYDFSQQPAALRKMHQIIGERWELKDAK
jgi:hypothetical protein